MRRTPCLWPRPSSACARALCGGPPSPPRHPTAARPHGPCPHTRCCAQPPTPGSRNVRHLSCLDGPIAEVGPVRDRRDYVWHAPRRAVTRATTGTSGTGRGGWHGARRRSRPSRRCMRLRASASGGASPRCAGSPCSRSRRRPRRRRPGPQPCRRFPHLTPRPRQLPCNTSRTWCLRLRADCCFVEQAATGCTVAEIPSGSQAKLRPDSATSSALRSWKGRSTLTARAGTQRPLVARDRRLHSD